MSADFKRKKINYKKIGVNKNGRRKEIYRRNQNYDCFGT